MTAHVTQAKIKAALEAVLASGWKGGIEIDLRTGAVSRLPEPWPEESTPAFPEGPQPEPWGEPPEEPFKRKTPHPKGPPLPLACYRIDEWRAPRLPIAPEIKVSVWERDGDRCRYCGCERGPFSIDHIHPISRGGDNALANLAVACAACNLSKHSKLLFEEWDPPCCYPHTHVKHLPNGGAVLQRRCDKCSIVATCGASVSGA